MRGLLAIILAGLILAGCQTRLGQNVGGETTRYESVYPLYAELCAASQFRKRPDYPPPIEGGGFGGHSVLYLNGVCRVKDAHYPVIALCDKKDGVGLSVNAHYKNTNWVATEGRDFFFGGDLKPGERLTKQAYDETVARAEAMGILDGVVFHDTVFRDKPAGTSLRDYMYQVSLGTDYALSYARDRYCARIPLSRDQMQKVVTYLNDINTPYRSGAKSYRWNVVKDNCNHLSHNALAVAGIWKPWPTHRPLIRAAFSFPVPKNEFVNLIWRTNNGPIDFEALYADPVARAALLAEGEATTQPGGLAVLSRMVTDNEIYDPDVELVFYNDPMLGPYERRFRRIQTEARYSDLRANLGHFSELYRAISASRKPLSWHLAHMKDKSPAERDDFATVYTRYYGYIERQRAKVDRALTQP
jgi:hypothetical protein